MKINIRNSGKKHKKMTGFLTRMKTRGGRKVIARARHRRHNRKDVYK